MPTDIFKDVLDPKNRPLWYVLAFQAGFMNAGGFLACHRFVSHVTGYGTYVGISLGEHDYLGAIEMALAPLFFLAGATYAGLLVDRQLVRGGVPRLRRGLVVLASVNLIIFTGEESGYLGEFGEPLVLQRDFLLLFLLCFACGLQNGLFTSLTNGQVRTTHLTGPTTDVGLNLAKAWSLPANAPERREIVRRNWLRASIIGLFSLGSMIATYVFSVLTYEGFAVPFATSVFLIAQVHWRLVNAPAEAIGQEDCKVLNQPLR